MLRSEPVYSIYRAVSYILYMFSKQPASAWARAFKSHLNI